MRILVAEDDAPLAEFLHQRLEQEQFAVQLVSNGVEAERLASEQPYDLVILDLNLPGAGGLNVLRGIRSKRPDLPVVMVTAFRYCSHTWKFGSVEFSWSQKALDRPYTYL